jgi:hypothetical protein
MLPKQTMNLRYGGRKYNINEIEEDIEQEQKQKQEE